ncbi:hypothetical protein [Aggregatibacter kilianii]
MYAEKASQAIGSVPLIVTGGFRSRDAMEQALAEGSLDWVGIAKPFALIPDLPQRMLLGGLAKAELPAVRTGLGFIDRKLGGFLELGWYAYQMKLINTGNAPQPKRSA